LGYDGVVISDDMQMDAIAEQYGFETALFKTIEAGVDLVAIANVLAYDEEIVARGVGLVTQWVEEGRIGEERIDQSYRRIQRLKDRLTPEYPPCSGYGTWRDAKESPEAARPDSQAVGGES
jgi:beta-N-acetylhexosaminidase